MDEEGARERDDDDTYTYLVMGDDVMTLILHVR